MTTPPAQTPPPGTHPTPEVPTPIPVPVHLAVGASSTHLGDLGTEPERVRRDLAALLREAADVIEHGLDDDQDEDAERRRISVDGDGSVELYADGRYIAVTGRTRGGTPRRFADMSALIDQLLQRAFSPLRQL